MVGPFGLVPNPARGDLFIEYSDQPPFLLFFSGAAGAEFDRQARPAPLKNKKNDLGRVACL
jgi:hypothetical protein